MLCRTIVLQFGFIATEQPNIPTIQTPTHAVHAWHSTLLYVVAHGAEPTQYCRLIAIDESQCRRRVERVLVAEGVVLNHVVDRNTRVVVVNVHELRVASGVWWVLVVQFLKRRAEAPGVLCRS